MDWLPDWISTVAGLDVAKALATFGLAAWIHSGRVKKEIANQMSSLVGAINNLGEALRADMNRQSQRIDFLESEVNQHTSRLSSLETEH